MSLQRLFTATLSGIVIGILIAPAKGTDTRKKLVILSIILKIRSDDCGERPMKNWRNCTMFLKMRLLDCVTMFGKKCSG